MPVYQYQAKDFKGTVVKGQMEAPEEKVVAQALREHKLIILKISEKKNQEFTNALHILDRVTQTDLLNYTRQFAIMITSGLSIIQALTILHAQGNKKSLQALLESILHDVQSGQSLAKAYEKFPKVFNPSYIALIRAGESGGLLEQVMPRMADTLEKQAEFRSKTKGAFIYPIIILIGMAIVMVIMMVFVVPKLTSLYSGLGTQLPLPTEIMITLSNLLTGYWWIVTPILVGAGVAFYMWKKTPMGKTILDTISFRLPIFGSLKKANVLTELTRTLGLLISSGVPIIDALHIVAKTTGSTHYEQAMNSAAVAVEKGVPLATALPDQTLFPKIVAFMVQTGEETGKLGDVLLKLSHFFEVEAEQRVKNLTVAMEPLIMIILGVGVGFLILSIILPIYKITQSF